MNRDIESAIRSRKLIAAHRGGGSLAPENTLAAAQRALVAGAGMWEIDVRMSKDGELVLLHDPDLKRTSDAQSKFPGRSPWLVSDFKLEDLKRLDFGSWFAEADPFGLIAVNEILPADFALYAGEQIVTLAEAILFTVCNDWLLNIEIKDLPERPGGESAAEKLVSLINSLDAADRVLVSSFNYEHLARIRKLDGSIRTGVLTSSFQPDPAALLYELGAFTFNPGLRAFCPWQIRRLKQKGFGVLVWVINNPWLAKAYFAMGADGIFTDFPQRF
jgi:glycerophosphoryl diester phosphodiesterase